MVIINPHNHTELENVPIKIQNTAPKEKRRKLRRGLKILPNLFTLANAFFGFCAMVLAFHKNPQAAAYCILLGASMDSLDGRIARLTQSTSPLGMQLDSLADAITFCLAPAFVIYVNNQGQSSLLIFFACAFYLLAGLFRLARFNVTSQQQITFFMGLPTTLSGCFLAISILSLPLREFEFYTTFLMLTLAILMVSKWRFPTFKKASKRWIFTSATVIGVTTATFGFNRVLFVLYILYFTLGFFETIRIRFSKNISR